MLSMLGVFACVLIVRTGVVRTGVVRTGALLSGALLIGALLAGAPWAQGQAGSPATEPGMQVPKVVPVPSLRRNNQVKEPTSPPARDVRDRRDGLTFHLPAGWDLSAKDGEISAFRLDARSAPRNARLGAVASLAFNPYPQSTFEGALFYVSSVHGSSAKACAAQTATKPYETLPPVRLDGLDFTRGKDEHGHICTESRDVAYTAMRGTSCLRIDLAIHSFCGGEVSGAQDLTEAQLDSLLERLEGVLASVHKLGPAKR